MMEELDSAIKNYLENGDCQLLLVAISQSIGIHQSDTVSSLLLQYNKEIVKTLGWDLLTLLTPHLPPLSSSTSSSTWKLIITISEVCSAKEMCLALLEQLEAVTSSPPLFFNFLTPLLSVIKRLEVGDDGGRRHVSTLRSVRSLLARVYPDLSGKEDEDGEEEEFSPLMAAGYVMALVEPFTVHIHHLFTSPKTPLQMFWSPLQRETVSLLLTLLGPPLVTHDLSQEDSDSRKTADLIMRKVVQCHCGCLQLLESGGEEDLTVHRVPSDDDDDDGRVTLPPVGVACFVYLLLVEEVENGYLPTPLHPHHLLHTSLIHFLSLTNISERQSIVKGLLVLEKVLSRVETHSLSGDLVCYNRRYLNTAQRLVDIMVTCQHKNLRQRSLSLLPSLIRCFPSATRQWIYKHLLRSCTHPGVQGLLIQHIKNEVDRALLQDPDVESSHFLGRNLIPLLNQIFTFSSSDSHLLGEIDKVMAGLNFLRYLLIRDPPTSNITAVWSIMEQVKSQFVEPIRRSLENSKIQLRYERGGQRLLRGGTEEEGEEEEEVAELDEPDISPEEQERILQLASHQLDMMECVLVRVEELLDERHRS